MTDGRTIAPAEARSIGTGAGRLRAAQLTGPGQIAVIDCPLPEPAAGELRVRLEGCGVCASNLEPWVGPDWMNYPTEPGGLGHEGWGRVDALGEGVDGLARGDRVAFLGTHSYASHEIVPVSAVVRLPPTLDGHPVPAEPVACALSIHAKAGVQAGQTVAIIGVGFIGALLTQLASGDGARVISISRRQQSLDLARECGATEVIRMDDHRQIIEGVGRLTGGRMADVTIEAAGRQWPLDLAAEITREGGRLVIAGYHQDGPRQVNMQMWNWRAFQVVNAHERDQGRMMQAMRQAVAAMADGRVDIGPLLSGPWPLERLGEVLDFTQDKPGAFVKGWIRC